MLAPVLISVYDRVHFLESCINSIRASEEARMTDLYIAVDCPSKKDDVEKIQDVLRFCKSIRGFKTVNVIERKENLGPHRNLPYARKQLLKTHSELITLEDDNVVSVNFLNYMNNALKFYKDNDKIFCICGYNHPVEMPSSYKSDVFLWTGCAGYGVGWWATKIDDSYWNYNGLRDFLHRPELVSAFMNVAEHILPIILSGLTKGLVYGDAVISYNLFLNNRYQLYPVVSKVRNLGYDGDGVNCNTDSRYTNQVIDAGEKAVKFLHDIEPDPSVYKVLSDYFKISVEAKEELYQFLRFYVLENNDAKKAQLKSHVVSEKVMENTDSSVDEIKIPRSHIDKMSWSQRQISDELEFWKCPELFEPLEGYPDQRSRLLDITKNMFNDLPINFENMKICEIGGGAYAGLLSLMNADSKIMIDPLVPEYLNLKHDFSGVTCIAACAEDIPLCSESVDACICTNALDHMYEPYAALKEMYRILKPGGYFALAVDTGGTPDHPIAIEKEDLDNYLNTDYFEIIEKKCSSDIRSTWPANLMIPVYVFQGKKNKSKLDKIGPIPMLAEASETAGKTELVRDLAGQARAIESAHPVTLAGGARHETDDGYLPVTADDNLGNLLELGRSRRFGRWAVHFRGMTIRCHDLLSFYTAAKDIFLNRIYDFDAVRPDPVVIDGGGHIGLFSLYVKRKYPGARVTVFEPDVESLSLLEANLAANGLMDLTVVRAGLYHRDGTASFGSDHSDGSSIFSEAADHEIPVVRLGTYLQGGVDYLKLNIEGAELDVLEDIAPTLDQVREIVLEYHGFPELGQRLHPILAILDRAGFRYLVNDFDAHTNPATKPPFRLAADSRYFLLVYGRRLFQKAPASVEPGRDCAPRTVPVSRTFGFDRGTPIDRFYIEAFLSGHREQITGRVLEVGDAAYTRKFGIAVTRSDVLNANPGPGVTIVGDLAAGADLEKSAFDCIILTQTIQFIYDVKAALATAVAALKPGGLLLLTASGISQISRYDMDRWGEYWRFTDRSLERLLREAAPGCDILVESHGNVAVAKAFLDGLAYQELSQEVLETRDDDYQVVLTATVRKPAECRTDAGKPIRDKKASAGPSVLLYHRVADDPVDPQLLAVSPRHFEAHMHRLREECLPVSLGRLLNAVDTANPAENMVAVTFDDGYADNLLQALPVIESLRIPVTVFVTSGAVDSDTEFWWDALEHLFFEGLLPDSLDIGLNGSPPQPVSTRSPQERLAAYNRLCGVLRDASPAKIQRGLPVIYARAGRTLEACPAHRRLTSEELRRLSRSEWVEIGAHTVSHPRMSLLSSDAQIREIYLSKRHLEEICGVPIHYFSYPFGAGDDFTVTTTAIVRQCGFAGAVANDQGRVTGPVDRYRVPRRLVRNWSGETFHRWLHAVESRTFETEALSERDRRLEAIATGPGNRPNKENARV